MIRFALSAALAGLSAAAAMAASPSEDAATRINAAPARDGWFVCDAIDGPYALFAGRPGTDKVSVMTLLDRRTGRFDTQRYTVGDGDPGAGQIYWPLSQGGKEVGHVHGVNPGMIDDNGATVPPITGVKLGDRDLDCRFLSHTRFIGVDSRRSVVVTETPQGLVYQAFSFRKRGAVTQPDGVQRSNKPTLRLIGGSETTTGAGSPGGFRFANASYVYSIQLPRGGEAASLTVTRGAKLVQSEKFVGFTFAPPTGRAPESASAAPLGPDAVWSGAGLDACRKPEVKSVDDCMVDAMRRGGAPAAAIAFTRRLIADDNPGYISAWKQVGMVGVATVTYPFRANTNEGTWLVPTVGDAVDADAYRLTAEDKARADYRAAMANNSEAFPVPPGTMSLGKTPDGHLRILMTTATAVCHACAPAGQIVVGYDFDDLGRFTGAHLVAAA